MIAPYYHRNQIIQGLLWIVWFVYCGGQYVR